MSTIVTSTGQEPEAVWWQGNLFVVKGRAAATGGAIGLAEAKLWPGMATPLHIHHREDEAFYILEGRMRFRRGDEEFTAGAGDFVFGPREVPHGFKVLEEGARMLVLLTPAGMEQMFVDGGIPVRDAAEAPPREYDLERVGRLAREYGWDIVGPPLE